MLETILGFIQGKDMDGLKAILATVEELELLHAFIELSSEDQVIVFRLLTKDTALVLFETLDTDLQHNLLHSFTDEKVIEFVNELAPDDRVRLLDELPANVTKQLIIKLSPQERELTNLLMGYEIETAGRIMNPKFISLNRNMTVTEALNKVRKQAAEMETVYALYVTDGTKKLKGVLNLKELVCADPDTKIEDLMAKKAISVATDTAKVDVAYMLQELDLIAIPVVDKEGCMVGIVTIDDAVDILENEATEHIFDQAGITGSEVDRGDILIGGKLSGIWKVRLPFLLFAVAAAMVSGFVIDGSEEILQSIAVIAVFIPLIMTMGGNVGTQSSTIFVRGVVTGQILVENFRKHFFKELGVGVSLGFIIGSVSSIAVIIWQGNFMIGIVVGLSLLITMTSAALLGFLVPFVLLKFKLDQAAGTTPILTAIIDILGLIIYFVLVTILLGHIL